MGRKEFLLDKVAKITALQEEPLPGLPLVELAGDKRLLIEHHKGVTEYGREQICVRVAFGQIRICGLDMELCHMTRGKLVIFGKIHSVTLQRRDG